ncbi:unnamed protein product [Phytomonas sp. Hart1]|nr:unnamed protein product [Phytomonas sp. Hart1]|eukprot:CCW66455.1 unnamed protein product [Phytomonas sp. isolate Hart1]
MLLKTLSSHIRLHPEDLDRSSQKLTCTSKRITEVDINPSALCRLVAKGSNKVQAMARAYVALLTAEADPNIQPRGLSPGPSNRLAPPTEDSYLNLVLAFSLHTVLLSRNRLTRTLGCVQFRNVVRLSLLGNGLRRVEDCEPLGLLSQLTYLSLEFNPVTALPHYRAHLLRICSFPHSLEDGRCRLRKLDGGTVRMAEITTAALCLQREMGLLPELLQRHHLVSFLTHVEKTMRVHEEMRKCGIVIHCLQTDKKLDEIVKHCSKAVLGKCGIEETVHTTQLLIAQYLKRFKNNQKNVNFMDSSNHEGNPMQISAFSSNLTVNESVEMRMGSNGSVISVLDEASEILLEDLQWSKDTLRNAGAVRTCSNCKVCSQEVFCRLVSMLDVKVCACLLRIARLLGLSLFSKDVDALCGTWLSTVLNTEETILADIYAKKTQTTPNKGYPKRLHMSKSRSINKKLENIQEMDFHRQMKKTPKTIDIVECRSRSSSLLSPSEHTPPMEESVAKPNLFCELFPENNVETHEEETPSMRSAPLIEQTLSSASKSTLGKSEKDPENPRSLAEDEKTIQMESDSVTKTEELAELTPLQACLTPSYPSPDASRLGKNIMEVLNSKSTPSDWRTNKSSEDEESRLQILSNAHLTAKKRLVFRVWREILLRNILLRKFYQCVSTRMKSTPILRWVSSLSMLRLVFDLTYLERKRVFFTMWKQRKDEIQVIRNTRKCVFLRLWYRQARTARLCKEIHYKFNRRRAEEVLSIWKRSAMMESERRFRESKTKGIQGPLQPPPAMMASPINGKNQNHLMEKEEGSCFRSHIHEHTSFERHPYQSPASNLTFHSFHSFKDEVQSPSSSFPPTERKKVRTPSKAPPASSYEECSLGVEVAMADIRVSHPFSEEDVAALVEKASFLLKDREVLVKRLVDQLVECEKARAVSRWYKEKVVMLQSDMNKRVQREEEERRVRQEYEIELKHLRKSVEELRQERREWFDKLTPCEIGFRK